MNAPAAVLAMCLVAVPLSACNNDAPNNDGRLTVAVAFYPIEEVVREVGGTSIDVISLVPPGGEAHEYEPTARQVARLESADIVFYLGSDFQPSLQQVIESLPESVRRVDLLQGLTLINGDDGIDPHVWLDPKNMDAMATAVLHALSTELPPDASIEPNWASYVGEINALHEEFVGGLKDCDVPVLITTHHAFAYLANAYGLTYRAIAGVSPGDEPSAQSLEDLAAFAEQNSVTTIFYEQNLPSELAQSVASEVDGTTAGLATAESLTDGQLSAGESYISLMRENLRALRAGMGCT